MEAIAQYPLHVQQGLCHPTRGVQSRCKFLPTVADVVELADAIQAKVANDADFDRRHRTRRQAVLRETGPYRPFPQLWEAFGVEFMDDFIQRYDIVFDALDDACKKLLTHGRDEADRALKRAKLGKHKNRESARAA